MSITTFVMDGDGSPQNQEAEKHAKTLYFDALGHSFTKSEPTANGIDRGASNSKESRGTQTDKGDLSTPGEANAQTLDTPTTQPSTNDTKKNTADRTSAQVEAKEQSTNSSDEVTTRIILVGNPGVGKSTILNTLVGKAEFESGLSLSGGRTKNMKSFRHGEYEYVDTPGLEDVAGREEAAEQISLAFRGPTQAVLIFVIVLDEGRVRPADLSCMELVLSSLETNGLEVADKHSIIINKCGPKVYRQLAQERREEVIASFNFVRPVSHVHALELDRGKEEEDNTMLDEKENLLQFVRSLPILDIGETAKVCVDVAAYEAKKRAMAEELIKGREPSASLRGAPPTPSSESSTPRTSSDEPGRGRSSGEESGPSSQGSKSEALRQPVLNMGLKVVHGMAAKLPTFKLRKS